MHPLALSEVPDYMNNGMVDRPYFVITFDDGYKNILSNTFKIVTRYRIRPTLFVNSRFAEGGVYYRVLSALLCQKGYARILANKLQQMHNTEKWSEDPKALFAQTKNLYKPGIIEDAVEPVYHECLGNPDELRVHLNLEEIGELQLAGWEIGNHTYDHKTLSNLSYKEIDKTISKNKAYLESRGISIIDWIAYPNGTSNDVNQDTLDWFNRHANLQGAFCNGGVNIIPTRTEWLRIPVTNIDTVLFRKRIENDIDRVHKALGVIQRSY